MSGINSPVPVLFHTRIRITTNRCSVRLDIRVGTIFKNKRCPLSTSAIFSPEIKPAQSVNATKLRDLDTFEKFFWLLEQSAPLFHAVVAEVNGATTIEQWKNAFNAMQIRYPLLSASIRKVPGKRPFFQKVRGVSVPLRIAPLTDSLVVEEEMENELQHPFGDGSGPLT